MRELTVLALFGIKFIALIGASNFFYPSFFREDEVRHLKRISREDNNDSISTTSISSESDAVKEPCDEEKLINFLAEIQVINPESVMKLATLNEMDTSCKKVSDNLEKVENYLKTCTVTNQPDLYVQLIKGVEALHKKICTESNFKQKFEPFHKCLRDLKDDFEDCSGPPDWNENSKSEDICKAYKDITDCYYIKSAKVCGYDAAASMKELLQAVIDSIITVKCNNIGSNPTVKDPMPDTYLKKVNEAQTVIFANILAFIAVLLIIWL